MVKNQTECCVSAKPDISQVYSLNEAGGASDQLPMKHKKSAKGICNYPFLLLEKNNKTKTWQRLIR